MKPCSLRGAISLSLLLLLLAGTDAHARNGGHGGRGSHGGHAGNAGFSGRSVQPAPQVSRGSPGMAGPHWRGGGFPAARGGAVPFHRGHWVHGVRGGHAGWWWVAGPAWYLYAAPVYPYPAALSDTVIIEQPSIVYYCSTLQAYYPDVQVCPVPWTAVLAQTAVPAY